MVPKTWVPICITDQVSHDTIKGSDDFRLNLQKGLIELLSGERARELLSDPDADEELARLNISKYSSFEGDMKKETVSAFAEKLEVSDNVAIVVKDILNREVSVTDKFHMLRGEEENLKVDDYRYIALHGEGKVKEWAQGKIQA